MAFDPHDPVITPEALAAELHTFLLLDARPAETFAEGRAEGAVRLPIEAWERAAKSPEGMLTNTAFWATELGQLGVNGTRPIAVLDDGRITEAARAWFILQHFGVPAAVVDGGWPALEPMLLASGVIERGKAQGSSPVTFTPRPSAGRVALIERAPLRDVLTAGDRPQVFDARTAAEYSGEDLRKNRRGGHLPGASNLPHTRLLGEGNRLRSASELRAMLEEVGLRPGDRIVTHCDGGGRAALAALAAVRAGYAEVSAYYLSFSDWAADESCPVQR